MVQWKTYERKRHMLRKLGYDPERTVDRGEVVISRKRYWRQSRSHSVSIAMNSTYWASRGYRSFTDSWSRSRHRITS